MEKPAAIEPWGWWVMNAWCALQRDFLLLAMRVIAGVYPLRKAPFSTAQKIYFSNHTSNLDTLAILAALPREARAGVRPVAARDYWGHGGIRRYIAQQLLHVVLIDRHHETGDDPLMTVRAALAQGDSIIFFPEGTRGADMLPQAFKSGLFFLASEFPQVELVPVYLENLQRIMPKGTIWPVPLICKVHFGTATTRGAQEDRMTFLARMRDAVIALAPHRAAG